MESRALPRFGKSDNAFRRAFPRIAAEWFSRLLLSQSRQDRRIQDQFPEMLRMLCGKATGCHGAPVPSKNIDLLLSADVNDHVYCCIDVLCRVCSIRHKHVFYWAGLPVACYVESPYGISLPGESPRQAVILVVNIKLMG